MSRTANRTAFFLGAAEHTPYLAVRCGHALFLVRTGDGGVARSLFVKQHRGEMGVLDRVVRFLEELDGGAIEGRTFVDVGANIGTSTVWALTAHAFGDAVACEPEPENVRVLRANVALNGLAHEVRVLPVAVSSGAGHGQLALHTQNDGAHQLVSGDGPSQDGEDAPRGERILVEKATLDGLAADGLLDPARVGLVWIDAQGHEGHILKGARGLVTAAVPIVLEYYPSLLTRTGGLDAVTRAAAKYYTHFVDLRSDRALTLDDLRPSSELAAYGRRFADGAQSRFTDVLLLRVEG